MKDKLKAALSFFKGKGLWALGIVCLFVAGVSAGAIYRSATNLVRDFVTPQTSGTQQITYQVEAEKDDEPDPRLTTEQTTERTTVRAQEKTTTEAESQTQTTQEQFSNASFTYPVEGEIIKDYSETPVYDETMDDWRVHKGIDIICPKGCNVSAVGDGRVTRVYLDASFGYCIEIDHGDFVGRYCGLEQGTTVEIDALVTKNDIVGVTGEIACEKKQQEHFHFEALKDGKNVDPVEALR